MIGQTVPRRNLTEDERETMEFYIKKFYKMIDSPRDVRTELEERCAEPS